MKKALHSTRMLRRWLNVPKLLGFTLACFALSLLLSSCTDSTEPTDPCDDYASPSRYAKKQRPFRFGGHTYRDIKEFAEKNVPCATRQPSLEEVRRIEEALRRFNQTEKPNLLKEKNASFNPSTGERNPGSVLVSVYVHVINKGSGLSNGDVTDQMISDLIVVMNNSFGGLTGGTKTPFTFKLAGYDRTTNAEWFELVPDSSEEMAAKSALRHQDLHGAKTLNIYTAVPISPEGYEFGGWGTFPWDYAANPVLDGVVLHYDSLPGGTLGGTDGYYDYNNHLGDIGVHEVGHWLGLFHTFQNGCSIEGDAVDDTPAQSEAVAACCPDLDTCVGSGYPGYDPLDNFMGYTDDVCRYKFTPGQSTRMDSLSLQYRGL